MTSEETPQGWIILDVPQKSEEWAKAFRAERDQLYGNIFGEEETDERWVGDLGELVFKSWLNHHQVKDYEWIKEGAAGAPDFKLVSGVRIGVKTVKRQVPMKTFYTAQITARHTEEPIEQFFFMSYEIPKRKMWLLGGIDKQGFLDGAVYHPAGSQVHANYKVRTKHAIWNIDVQKLVPPHEWLLRLTQP